MARKTSFYYSFLVLPKEQRRAIEAVWDFCRAVDDAVDEPAPDLSSGDAVGFWRSMPAPYVSGAGQSRCAAKVRPASPLRRRRSPCEESPSCVKT